MSVPSSTRSPPSKPSGPVIYTQSKGANIWPDMLSREIAFVRVLDGELVVFQEFMGNDKVAVSVGGQDRVLTRADWRALPVYEG